jgi:hypothetical protein
MILKIYGSIWFLFALTGGVLFLTGLFGLMTAIVFGFITFGLIWFGMLGILPMLAESGHHHAIEAAVEKPAHQAVTLKPALVSPQVSPVLVSHN